MLRRLSLRDVVIVAQLEIDLGPGFTVDEDPAHLGEALILPPAFEHLRERVEAALTPATRIVFVETIANPRTQVADLARIGSAFREFFGKRR